MKPFFLSHSSVDKDLVRKVATALGQDQCWLDEWELIGGDDLFQNIDSAIDSSATKVFVVFWSESAKASAWVEEEVASARIRKLRRKDMEIVPIQIGDTDMPLWMSHLLYINANEGIESIANDLRRRLDKVNIQVQHERAVRAEGGFVGRQKEIDRVEKIFNDEDVSCVVIAGFPGIGKSSLCRYVLQQRLPHLKPIWVDFERSSSPALFFSTLAENLSLRLPKELLESGEWISYWRQWILPSLDVNFNTIVLDGMGFVVDALGRVPNWLEPVFSDWMSRGGVDALPLIVITGRAVEMPPRLVAKAREVNVQKMSSEDIIRILRLRMTQSVPKRIATREQLAQAAQIVSGYPLGAQLWAAYAARVGVELALRDPVPVQRQVQAIVGDIIAKCRLSDEEQWALLLLSVSRFPLSVQVLVDGLGVSARELISLQRSMLLESTSDDELSVHGLVGDYLISSITSHQEVRRAHEQLGELFLKEWKASPIGFAESAALASRARYHLLASGKINEASMVSWSATEEAKRAIVELYRTRQDASVIALAESVQELGGKDTSIMFYYALSLGRRKASKADRDKAVRIFQEILAAHPNNGFYWSAFGDMMARFGEIQEAKDAYMKARSLRTDDAVPSERLGELLLREGDLKSASVFLSEAYRKAPQDSRVIASYASLLQRTEKRDQAFKIVSDGLRRRPDDIQLNHRAGLLLKDMGNQMEALKYLSRAAKGDSYPASYISLADLYLEMGKIEEAKKVLSSHPGSKSAAYYNIAGNIARREEHFAEAEELFAKCKKMEGETVFLLGSIASLKIAQAEKAIEMMAYVAAKAYIVDAEEAIRKGLEIEAGNDALLWIKKDLDRVRLLALKEGRK